MLVEHLPRESALSRAVHGDRAAWGDTEYLLALISDALHAGNWQRGGGKGQRPKPLRRPGEVTPHEKRYGGSMMPLSAATEYFARWRAGAYAGGEN